MTEQLPILIFMLCWTLGWLLIIDAIEKASDC